MSVPSPMIGTASYSDPKILRIFISYASEDLVIATAIAKSLRDALGDVFAEVNIDRWFLEAGAEFRSQIESKLERTDVFISLYTGTDKQWTAWEVGFFERVMKESAQKRKLVPMFLDAVPPAISSYQSLGLQIPPAHLRLGSDEFAAINAELTETDPICRFLTDLQETVDAYRHAAGFSKAQRTPEQNAVNCVKTMKMAIFNYLKTTVEATIRPQKQTLIRTRGSALLGIEADLPDDAQLVPVGQGNTMSTIFGLTDTTRSWKSFLQEAAINDQVDSWRAAIVSVITSSLDNRIDVDNSQIIVSSDDTKAYRVILTSAIRYYDDTREFNLYFVETLRRGDYGDELTSLLLKAIEISCRFRFLFFEKGSPFSSTSVALTSLKNFPSTVNNLVRELNLLRKDSRDAGLDQAHVWLRIVDPDSFREIVQDFQPHDTKIRQLAGRVVEVRGNLEAIAPLQAELCASLTQLEHTVGPGNLAMIQYMTTKLQAAAVHANA